MKHPNDAAELKTPGQRGSSLRFRLTTVVVATALMGLAVSTVLDYRRERKSEIDTLLNQHEEQIQMIISARERASTDERFASYVTEVCHKMSEMYSPGHHILVLDPGGQVLVNADEHSVPEVTRALLALKDDRGVMPVAGHLLSYVRARDAQGNTFIIGEYLDLVEKALNAEVLSRTLTAIAMAAVLIAVIFVGMSRWMLGPVGRIVKAARAWARRDFSARAEPSGPADIRTLADEFNGMADELQRVEHLRRADLDRAREIQKNLLPSVVPTVPGLSVAGLFRPAEFVAGDLYDIFPVGDGRTAVFILDVAGHGVSAALLTGVVKMLLQRRLAEIADLSQAVRAVNADLMACAEQGAFVTACIGVWNPVDRTWTYCAAGHHGGLLVCGGRASVLPSTGALLGVMNDEEWTKTVLTLHDGDRLLLFTDGVTDAGEPEEPLGAQGAVRILMEFPDEPFGDQMRRIADESARRCSLTGLCDDITMVGLEVLPGTRGGPYYAI